MLFVVAEPKNKKCFGIFLNLSVLCDVSNNAKLFLSWPLVEIDEECNLSGRGVSPIRRYCCVQNCVARGTKSGIFYWKAALVSQFSDVTVILSIKGRKIVLVCLLYTSPSPRDRQKSRMPSSA